MPGIEYIPKLKEVEGVEGGRPPHQAPIWQEHPIRWDLQKLQHKRLAETLHIVECWNASLDDWLLYYNFNINVNTDESISIHGNRTNTSVNSKVGVCRC